jgi:hypothetical protein
MPRTVLACMLVAAALVAALPSVSAGSGPQAGASRACHLSRSEQDHLGTTYVISLRVSGTTCANGKKVVRAYHKCRHDAGGRDGRCHKRIFGYRCTERRLNVIPSQYDARARCTKSGREIFHKYTQNT